MDSVSQTHETEALLAEAGRCLDSDNLPQAEAICRHLIACGVHDARIHTLLGRVAQRLNVHDVAVMHFRQAADSDPGNTGLQRETSQVLPGLSGRQSERQPAGHGNRFLLIKAWGYGFWADVDHVLGQLLLAEITGRIPVVFWGSNSLFRTGNATDAFTRYFDPLSDYTLEDLRSPAYSYFPGKWNHANLLEENHNKWTGPDSRMAGIYYLARDEDIAVSDFHTYVKDLAPWIPAGHHLHGQDPQRIYRYLFGRYLRVRDDLQREIQAEWTEKLAGKRTLAVHVRGSDKIHEDSNLHATHQHYHRLIAALLEKEPDLHIFLITDSTPVFEEYRQRYGDRLIHTDSIRSSDNVGVHLKSHDPFRVGREVLRDVYLAAPCNYFLGTGSSNVSTSILHTREWRPGQYQLLGHNYLFGAHLTLHSRKQ